MKIICNCGTEDVIQTDKPNKNLNFETVMMVPWL